MATKPNFFSRYYFNNFSLVNDTLFKTRNYNWFAYPKYSSLNGLECYSLHIYFTTVCKSETSEEVCKQEISSLLMHVISDKVFKDIIIHAWDRYLIDFKTSSPSVLVTKTLWTDQRWLTYTARFLASSSCTLSSGWRTVTELNWFLTSSVNHSVICDLW